MARTNWLDRVRARGIPIYGDTTFRGECPLEDHDLIEYFNDIKYDYPALRNITIHAKMEGLRSGQQARRDKMKGALTKGIVDVITFGSPSFVMELKRRDYTQSKIDDEQIDCLEAAMKAGSFACVALGIEAARQAREDWLIKAYGKGKQQELPL